MPDLPWPERVTQICAMPATVTAAEVERLAAEWLAMETAIIRLKTSADYQVQHLGELIQSTR